jgi:hypothetical protein
VIALLVAVASCARARDERQPPAVAASAIASGMDEATGRVVEVGSDPTTWLALEVPGGTQTRLVGPGATMLRAVDGATVWVRGTRTASEFSVETFEIRRIGDQDVDDGIIVATAAGVELRMRSGTTRAVPLATPALREIAGARVWISRPVAGVTPSYGVIAPKP